MAPSPAPFQWRTRPAKTQTCASSSRNIPMGRFRPNSMENCASGTPGPMLLIGGGSGMSPLWSILADHIASEEQRPVRFFYGARTRADLFYLKELAAIGAQLKDFKFVPALSHAEVDDEWDGETGFVHEVVLRHLREEKLTGAIDAYACGPTPMIDAVLPVLQMNGVEPDHIYFDKFTPAVR